MAVSRRTIFSPLLAGAALLTGLCLPAAFGFAAQASPVDFDREVRSILSENCFACHGFDENTRMAGLRLDLREGALAVLKSGKAAVVPGDPEASELLHRVTLTNALRMPPRSTGKELTPAQVDTLRRWIADGATYADHWAFVPPTRPAVPKLDRGARAKNAIDHFILARLKQAGLKPSPEADRITLIRRLSLDLTGLPPTPAEVNSFLGDTRPDAYERLVDRLLDSERYGERMAVRWLDLARYADTHGFHIDSHRDMWLWRDWVIGAFNRNLPYDQFITEQLAGDLLPNPSRDQLVATGFNRNHPINYEGGAIPDEYLNAYIVDRVSTTSTVFLGLTMACAQCHDHKYDPISQKDFYRFYAYFHSIEEQGLDGQRGNAQPMLKVPSQEQERRLAEHAAQVSQFEQSVRARAEAVAPMIEAWASNWTAAAPTNAVDGGLVAHWGFEEGEGNEIREAAGRLPAAAVTGTATWKDGQFGRALSLDGETHAVAPTAGALAFDRDTAFSAGAWIHPTAATGTVLARMDGEADLRGWDVYLSERRLYAHLIHKWEGNAIRVHTEPQVELKKWSHVLVTYDGSGKGPGVRIYLDGKPVKLKVTHDTLTESFKTDKPVLIGRRPNGAAFNGLLDEVRVFDRALTATEAAQVAAFDGVRAVLAVRPEDRTEAHRQRLKEYFLAHHDPEHHRLAAELEDWRRKHRETDAAIPTTMVMKERAEPRDTHILIRGEYDKKGDKVSPGVPGFLPPLPDDSTPNRLTLAQWLVRPDHPLTARVAVNRFWEMFFGVGIVKTSEDFGSQSEQPSNPELLDWLATEFVETGWDVKGLVRLLVTSSTYRQSARATPELLEKDPENRLLARAPRLRLPAEFIRDQALFVSGLLVGDIGGPSVKPYQPLGLWEEISFGGDFTAQKYEPDTGEALYRRSMYTFWKRTSPPPSLQIFDAPDREFCVVNRSASNTPLQALVLMNDPTYVEAARKFAERMLTDVAATPRDRIRYGFRLALARQPSSGELRTLLDLYEEKFEIYRQDQEGAEKLLEVGESRRDIRLDPAQVAAWTAVAMVLFNLDEMINRN
jgi:hypothetical protein